MDKHGLRLERLPTIVFVRPDGEESLDLSRCASQVGARVRLLQERLVAGRTVGLIFRTGPALVLNWLACLAAGFEPVILQYPTEKLTRAHWRATIGYTIHELAIGSVLCSDEVIERGIEFPCATIDEAALLAADHADSLGAEPQRHSFSILQLSSGTTGQRKPIRFSSRELHQHLAAYNRRLGLDARSDVIVSWLPLYHDMGFIACFVMPLILGVPVVLLDPMDWTKNPRLLFDAIRGHAGTTCFMPNFGFEVMSRLACEDALPSMRRWISCAEPVRAKTMERFRTVTGAAPESLHACYGMAENVFAVSQSAGIRTRRIGDTDVVSCGKPIDGCKVRVVDGELRVKSPAALRAYVGGGSIRDWRGYYATGDLGEIIDGEIYVVGRKSDLLNQAGRKFDLANLDLLAGNLLSESPGRIATIATFDAAAGTEKPVFLVESQSFFSRKDKADAASLLRRHSGIDHLDVEFVPPRFITKTSSGKIARRKTAEDWAAVLRAREVAMHAAVSLMDDLRKDFGAVDWSKPARDVLDSLALIVLQLILGAHGAPYDGALSLAELAGHGERQVPPATDQGGILVVILGDVPNYRRITDADLKEIEIAMGCPVHFEHICAPPSPILISDLVFHDYFMPRVWSESYRHFADAIARIKRASAIIVDDSSEIGYPMRQVYAALSHRLERDPRADLIAVRWQRYAEGHGDLPCCVVTGADLPPSTRKTSLAALESYLQVPIFKIARVNHFAPYTQGWDLVDRQLDLLTDARPIDAWTFTQEFGAWLVARKERLARRSEVTSTSINLVGLAHFCSWLLSGPALDTLLGSYRSFCLVGSASSAPHVERRLRELGKPWFRLPVYSRALQDSMPPHDCVLVLGPTGLLATDKPVVAPMQLNETVTFQNVHDTALRALVFYERLPTSSVETLFGIAFDRTEAQQLNNYEMTLRTRLESASAPAVTAPVADVDDDRGAEAATALASLARIEWSDCSGFGLPEGPIAEVGLRSRFRWIVSRGCTVSIQSPLAQPAEITLQYWNLLDGQRLRAAINGKPVLDSDVPVNRYGKAAAPSMISFQADLLEGRNELKLDFSASSFAPKTGRTLVVIVEKLTIASLADGPVVQTHVGGAGVESSPTSIH